MERNEQRDLVGGVVVNGAGRGNRTLTTSLEGWGSTVELHPRIGLETRSYNGFKFCQVFFSTVFEHPPLDEAICQPLLEHRGKR